MSDERTSAERARRAQAHARHGLRWPVRVSSIEPEIDPVSALPCYISIEASSVNLSEGGVFVPTEDTLTPGRRVLVEIDLPSGSTVQALGAVSWRRLAHAARSGDRPAGIGIEFTGIARTSALALAEALEKRTRPRTRARDRRNTHVHR